MPDADTASSELPLGLTVTEIRDRHHAFSYRVREEILRQRRLGWCTPGTNQVLEDLGLDPIPTEYSQTLRLTVEVKVDNLDDIDKLDDVVNAALTVNSGDSDVSITDWFVHSRDTARGITPA
ncbi:hypothetical protein L3Q67_01715 [Saccharothrix sp. AJ9571]|nr:hypothetical protein L3Q67_01715 [Saccharothrix sp. AJ9571]